MKFTNYLLLGILSGFLLFSCQSNQNIEDIPAGHEYNLAEGLSADEAAVFSLPSPFQVSAALRLMDLEFDDELIAATKGKKLIYTSTQTRAMNLGIRIIDLGYVLLYKNYHPAAMYLNTVEDLLVDMGYGQHQDISLENRLENSNFNEDTLKTISTDLMLKMQKYVSEYEEKKIPVLVMCGLYVEGLYFSVEIYNKILDNKLLTHSLKKNINQLLLQQRIYLSNLIILLQSFEDKELGPIIANFSSLNNVFENMNIEYKYDEENKQISSVTLNAGYIPQLRNQIVSVREKVIMEQLY